MKRIFSEEHKRNLRASFTKELRNEKSKFMKENNPMNNEANRRKQKINCRKAHRKLSYRRAASIRAKKQWTPKYRKMMKLKMEASWTTERRAALSRRMKRGRKHQMLMQQNGNRRRKGIPNEYIIKWRKKHPNAARRRDNNASVTMASNFKGCWSTFYKKGICRTHRFGKTRYDSGWERKFILRIRHIKSIKSFIRDFPIKYKLHGKVHRFLVDFILKTNKGKIAIEVKGKRFRHSKSTKAKLKYAKRYFKRKNWPFVLLTSIDAIKEFSL
jgi:hypothetical protein